MPHNRVVQTPIFRKKNFFKKENFQESRKAMLLLRVRACMYAYTRICVSLYIKYILYI